MKIIYLHNSGFLVELENITLVFDAITNIPPHFVRKGRKNYFFATSNTPNHFAQRIFTYDYAWNSSYILSSDVPKRGGKGIYYMKPYEHLDLDGVVKVHTFGSTESGVSFIVEAEGKIFFHAGTLNWWDWSKEDKPYSIPEVEEADFKAEIDRIRDALGVYRVDVAFVPVDARLYASAFKGASHIVDNLAPTITVPMYFEDDYALIDTLKTRLFGKATKILDIKERNQIIFDDGNKNDLI